MGCGSSKNTSDEQLESDAKRKNDSAEVSQKNRGQLESSWNRKTERCSTDDDFVDVVMESLRVNFDLITVDDFRNYISTRYLCIADESYQNEIIHKVIGEQFVKGLLAIKSI